MLFRSYLHSIQALSDLPDADLEYFSSLFQEKVYPIDNMFVTEDVQIDTFFVIIRGTARIEKDSALLGVAQPGSVIGAFDALRGSTLWASFSAESPLTTLKFNLSANQKQLKRKPKLMEKLWLFAGFEMAERLLVKVEPWVSWRTKKLRTYINSGKIQMLAPGEKYDLDNGTILLIKGEVTEDNEKVLSAPALLTGAHLKANMKSILFVLEDEVKEG